MKFAEISPDINLENEDNQKIEDLIDLFPDELRDFWYKKIEGKSNKEAIFILQEALDNRNITNSSIEINFRIKNPELKERIRKTTLEILKREHKEELFLGEGNYAKVWKMPFSDFVCVKHLLEEEQTEDHKKLMINEVSCLEDMHGFSLDGVRTPIAYFKGLKTAPYYLGMETVDGLSLKDIAENFSPDLEFIKYLQPENKEEIISRLQNFLRQMHIEKRIIHGDVHPGNIMIDKKGNFYIIDFGKAKRIELGGDYKEEEKDDLDSVEVSINEIFDKLLTLSDKNAIINSYAH